MGPASTEANDPNEIWRSHLVNMTAVPKIMAGLAGSLKSPRTLFAGGVLFYLLSIWIISQQYHVTLLDKVRGGASSIKILSESGVKPSDAKNGTLGFAKVFVINMKERTDKLDAVTLAASLTGFHVDAIEGVIGSEISNRTLPATGVPPKDKWFEQRFDNIAGCWRSHLNFARWIVSSNVGSALVMEDDADWSVYLKDQLEHVATGSRYISDPTSKTIDLLSPYGNDWDMLWLGHCGSSFRPESGPRYVIENDPTVPPPEHRIIQNGPEYAEGGYDNHTRIIYMANGGLCTQAYALSQRGARKVLQWYLNRQDFEPIDLGLHTFCHDQIMGFKCVAAAPALWGSHRAAGPMNRDSDIQRWNPDEPVSVREKGESYNIVHSMRMNGENILVNGLEGVTTQWDMPQLEGPVRTRYE